MEKCTVPEGPPGTPGSVKQRDFTMYSVVMFTKGKNTFEAGKVLWATGQPLGRTNLGNSVVVSTPS